VSRIIFTEELIQTFYDKIQKTYPELPLTTIDKICRAEFRMMKASMVSGELEDFRLQYLFKITVSPQRIIKQLHYMYKHKDNITPRAYEHYMGMVLNHIKNNKVKFKRYEDKIKKYTK
jgi:hypothetical protein